MQIMEREEGTRTRQERKIIYKCEMSLPLKKKKTA